MRVFRRRLLRSLYRYFRNRPILGAEIGVYKGITSNILLSKLPNLNLLMIDSYQQWNMLGHRREITADVAVVVAKHHTEFAKERRTIIVGTSEQAAKLIPDGSLDFAFIDANHEYEYVRQDIKLWYPKVKPTGLLYGHDYNSRQDRKHIWGVKVAVDEFAAQFELPLKIMAGLLWVVPCNKEIDFSDYLTRSELEATTI